MTRHLTKILLAASALTVLAAAPAASAATVVDAKLYSAKATANKPIKSTTKTIKLAERGDRSRVNRSTRTRNRSTRTRATRNRNANRNVTTRRAVGANRRPARVNRVRSVTPRISNRGRTNRILSANFNNRRGYRTNYRSNLGISFGFGTPGYSAYRWAPTAYSFYRPTYGSYGYYQSRTVCHRIIVDGWHHGYRAPISVKQCSNPWVGSYIVQGSERLVSHRW